ncbi:60S ribosomal protein L18a [Musa troglodytarum]|uniref:60S ribosomal protein L18a n=1 Tax=Musa troglodytarum TaxID=320322 RepID=A0A9E7JCJ5_9LILI|nr:60S ribosomal protein L18a [Musa troglodytarum]
MVAFRFRQYQVVGRGLPSSTDEHPKIYRMKLWATNEVRAKSKFWYLLRKLKKVKKSNGQVLAINEYNLWYLLFVGVLYYTNLVTDFPYPIFLSVNQVRSGTMGFGYGTKAEPGYHNMYKEYRDATLNGAVERMGGHRAVPRFQNQVCPGVQEGQASNQEVENHIQSIKTQLVCVGSHLSCLLMFGGSMDLRVERTLYSVSAKKLCQCKINERVGEIVELFVVLCSCMICRQQSGHRWKSGTFQSTSAAQKKRKVVLMGTATASVQRTQAAERLDVTAAAEIEAAEGADEDDGLEAVEDAEEEVVEEGEA